MDRLIIVLLFVCFSLTGKASEFFGGLTEYIDYASDLPCEGIGQSCQATSGLMGLTLDTASRAGLEITSILVKEKNSQQRVFAQSKKYGVCLVSTDLKGETAKIEFLCSEQGLINGDLKKLDHHFFLVKKTDHDFTLEEKSSTLAPQQNTRTL